ncbi:MAG: DUF4398 domain-containing protein [Hylemonella sp.]|nr:DUF4398 domain-containing protein [Hylemonella sp.]
MNILLLTQSVAQAASRRLTPWLAAAALTLAACASPQPAPTDQLAVSAAAIDQAVSAGAAELAPVELGAARLKLSRANEALRANDNMQARMLAEQSQADAQLAITKTRAAKAQKAASALAEDRKVLREEMQRNPK